MHGPTSIFRADLTLLTPALSRSQTSRELQGSYGPVLLTLSLLPFVSACLMLCLLNKPQPKASKGAGRGKP
jgi:hypothetical protein